MGLKVLNKRCDQCLFTNAKIVSDESKAQVLAECLTKDKHFVCHKAEDACCRGFYDEARALGSKLQGTGQALRVATALDLLEFV